MIKLVSSKAKKKIAREFLIFIFCIMIALITYITIYPYNQLLENEIEELELQVMKNQAISDSLIKSYSNKISKQYSFTERYRSTFGKDCSNYQLWTRLYDIARYDSVKYKWENVWTTKLITFIKDEGFHTPTEFQTFILNTIINKNDISQRNENVKIDSANQFIKIKAFFKREDIISSDQQLKIANQALGIAIIGCFLLRYLFYSIKWSIQALRRP